MKVCVTGASGFLGKNLIKELIKRDINVLSIIRNKEKINEYNSNYLIADLCNRKEVYVELEKFLPDTVVHCAAYIPRLYNQKEEILSMQNNVIATKNLLSIMEDIGIRNLIFISTISIYTGLNSTNNFHPFNETSNIYPEGFYGKDKLKSENLCINWSNKGLNRKCFILRLSGIHGGGRTDGVIFKFINKLLISEKIVIPSPFSRYSILYIDDAVKAILLLLEREKYITNEIFNIGGAEDLQLIEIARKIRKFIKSESILELGIQKPKLRSMDITKAQRELKFKPEPFDEWIKKEISRMIQYPLNSN